MVDSDKNVRSSQKCYVETIIYDLFKYKIFNNEIQNLNTEPIETAPG